MIIIAVLTLCILLTLPAPTSWEDEAIRDLHAS